MPTERERYSSLFQFTTTRPVAVLMITVAALVFGWVSYHRLSMNLMPDISYPSLTIRTEYSGAAPEEVETVVSRPVEQAVGVVSNLVAMSSISKAGVSDVVLEFGWDTDMNDATQDIREKLDQVFLPDEVDRPLILRYDPSLDPILRLSLYGDKNMFTLRQIAEDEIKRSLEGTPGIAAVKVKGGLEEEIRVELDETKLTLLKLDIQQINNRLSGENVNLASGLLKEGETEYLVRTLNEFQSIDDIGDLIVAVRNDKLIRIRDIGRVYKTNKQRELITRTNGQESVEIEIYKEADANIVAVADNVREMLFGKTGIDKATGKTEAELKAEAEKAEALATKKRGRGGQRGAPPPGIAKKAAWVDQLDPGVTLEIVADQSRFIKSAIQEVKNTAIMGGILAVIILFVFLRRLSSTVIIGVAIPISIIVTFAPMNIFDVTLNIMSLGGLALGVGMLVDNSIVVLESIFRCREEGDDIVAAAVRGTSEVGGAVFASTLTTISVFFPIVFVQGIAGQIFGDMALVVVFSLMASLLVALFLIPMLASRNLGEDTPFTPEAGEQPSFRQRIQSAPIFRFISTLDFRTDLDRHVSLFNIPLRWLQTLLLLPLEWLFKLLILFLSAILVLLKGSITFLLGLFYPLLFRLPYYRLREQDDHFSVIEAYALADQFFTLKISHAVLPKLLCFDSILTYTLRMRHFFKSFAGRRLGWQVLQGLFTPFALIYFTLQFGLLHLFQIGVKLIQLIGVGVGVILMGAFWLVLLVLMPVMGIILGLFLLIFGAIERAYPRLLKWSLHHSFTVLMLAVLLLAVCWFYYLPQIGSELIPQVHQGEFTVEIELPVGSPLEQTDRKIQPVEARLNQIETVQSIITTIGAERSTDADSDKGEHTAELLVRLKPSLNVAQTETATIRRIREELANFAGISVKITPPELFSFKAPIEVELKGYNLDILRRLSDRIAENLSQIDGLTDVKTYLQSGNPEVQIVYDRERLAAYDLDIYAVASLVKNKVQGDVPTRYRDEEERIDILVRAVDAETATLEQLRRIIINPGAEVPLPLEAVATVLIREGPSEIRRVSQQRTALLTANVNGISLSDATQRIEHALARVEMPRNFTYEITGQQREMQTSLDSLLFALALAIFLVYVVMACQFESLLHPFVILFSMPLAVIGVILALAWTGTSFSVVVFIGFIVLAGIVVNNAIVLVDYINRLRGRNLSKMEAIIQAGKVRLRPILMTTATTVLGLLPMALGFGDGAEIRTPMALTVIAGLLSSTLLTLLIIPTVYAVFDRGK
ncbi:MAG: efflux RND transporter permease subunit [Gemmatimonadetes bacterium]|nr:MAG: efflux RND transporter permease subunit [Gemmatimonadota bacterium]